MGMDGWGRTEGVSEVLVLLCVLVWRLSERYVHPGTSTKPRTVRLSHSPEENEITLETTARESVGAINSDYF